MKIKTRPSELTRSGECAASTVAPAVRIESARGPADLGTAFHECMAAIVKGRDFDAYQIANYHNVQFDELMPLVNWTRKAWHTFLAPMFPDPVVEQPMTYESENLIVVGHPDVLSFVESDLEIRGCDYKSGWSNVDAIGQLKGYALLGFIRWPQATVARMTKFQAREQWVDTFVWTRDEIMGWIQWIEKHLGDTSVYRPGNHCGFCRRALECEAHLNQMRSLASVALGGIVLDANMTPEQLGEAVLSARKVEKSAKAFVKAVTRHVEASGGKLGPLELTPVKRRTVRFGRAREILYEELGEDETLELATISVGDVEDAAKARAPRGHKGRVALQLIERLNEAGAIEVKTHNELGVRQNADSTATPAAITTGE